MEPIPGDFGGGGKGHPGVSYALPEPISSSEVFTLNLNIFYQQQIALKVFLRRDTSRPRTDRTDISIWFGGVENTIRD